MPKGFYLHAPRHKYGVSAKEDRTYNGRVYASKKECRHAQELDLQVKAGWVLSWEPQVRIPLYGRSGVKIGTYIADFKVTKKDGSVEIHAIKGYLARGGADSAAWNLKHRWLAADYPDLTIRVL